MRTGLSWTVPAQQIDIPGINELQVLSSPAAAGVLHEPEHPYDPTIELLYRDFCELLVRLSAVRYPQLPCLEQQVQQVITQHLLPLLGPGPGRTGGNRPCSVTTRTSSAQQGSSAAVASFGAASQMSAAGTASAAVASGIAADQLQQEQLVMYLQSKAGALQQLYAAILKSGPLAGQLSGQAAASHENQLVAGSTYDDAGVLDSKCWMWASVTVRQVVSVLQQTGVLQHWQLAVADVAKLLLAGVMTVVDPPGLR